jgi:2-polyprenyl-6-methoxyphenol hydroxylase-like FAD-dependent oxidoreductase
LALRLHQNGLAPIVIERSPILHAGGYMLGLSDPGYDAAERMHIADTLKAAQYSPRHLLYVTSDGRARLALEGRALEILVGERQLNLMRAISSACFTSGSAMPWISASAARSLL